MKLFSKKLWGVMAVLSAYTHNGLSNTFNDEISQEYCVQQEESVTESYAYFGPDVGPIATHLYAVRKMISHVPISTKNLDEICALFGKGKIIAPEKLVKAAVEEAVLCLGALRGKIGVSECEESLCVLEDYHQKLESGCIVFKLEGAGSSTHEFRARLKNRLIIGNLTIAGDEIVKGNSIIYGSETIRENLDILGNLVVGGNETIQGNLIVKGTIASAVPAGGTASFTLTGNPQQACLIFQDANSNEKARICSSPVPGDKGLFVSVDGGATQNLRVTNSGSTTITPEAGSTSPALTATGVGSNPAILAVGSSAAMPSLQIVNLPPSQSTDFFLTIDASGIVRESTASPSEFFGNAILNGGQPGPLTIGTTNATPMTFITNSISRVQIDQTGNTTFTGNIRLPQATPNVSASSSAGLTSGLIDLGIGAGSGAKVSLFDIGSRNLFAGYYAITPNPNPTFAADNIALGIESLQSITTGTGNVAIGPFASTGLTSGNNTVAIGNAPVITTANDSIAIGNGATSTTFSRAIVIGSQDSTNSIAALATASAANAIVIGSASGGEPAATASGASAISIGGADGIFPGASVAGTHSIGIGVNANLTAAGARSIVIGSASGTAGGVGPTTNSANTIVIGSASNAGTGPSATANFGIAMGSAGGAGLNGATVSAVGAVCIGSSDGIFAGASGAGLRSVNIGVNANTTGAGDRSVVIGSASGSVGGLAPTATAINGVVLGSADGANAGASSSAPSAIAIGGANSSFPGATVGGSFGVCIGTNANTSSSAAIVIGSASNNAAGFAPTAGSVNAIAVGSASGALAGASSSGIASIAIGGSDGVMAGAAISGNRSIGIGVNANSTAQRAIVIGSASGNATGLAPTAGANQAIAMGSAGGNNLPGASSLGIASIAVGGSDGNNPAASASGTTAIAIGAGAQASVNNGIALGLLASTNVNTNAVAIGSGGANATRTGASAAGLASIAIGGSDNTGTVHGATSTGASSIAVGVGTLTSGNNSIAMGSSSTTHGAASASGLAAVALGGSDGIVNGAFAGGTRSVTLGTNAMTGQNNAIILGDATGSTNSVTVAVGIGTSTPTAKLHVVGATPLQLVTPPASTTTDFLLTIDGSGIVRQGTASTAFANVIVNGGQPGPLTIGTTNAQPLTFVTNGAANNRLQITSAGDVVIAAPTTGTALTVNGSAGSSAVNVVGVSGQNAINTTVGTVTINAPTTNTALTVSSNATAPAILATGNSTIVAPALRLINNPTSGSTDFFLTIDGAGNVKQSTSTATFGELILNGGQPGPLTIGTTDMTPLTFITAGASRLQINSTGNVSIAAAPSGSALSVTGNGTVSAAALQLINIPASSAGDLSLTIDASSGVVKAGLITTGTAAIANGGQPGPLTIGTTNATGLDLVTNGATNTRLSIDSTGNVTYSSRYKMHAFLNTAQSVGSGLTVPVAFNQATSPGFDTNGNFTAGNPATPTAGTYTAPLTGYYLVSVNLAVQNSSANVTMSINLAIGGVSQTSYSCSINSETASRTKLMHVTNIIQLNEGNLLSVNFTNPSGTATIEPTDTHIDVHFMSF